MMNNDKRRVMSEKCQVRSMMNELCHFDRATQESRFIGKKYYIKKPNR